MTPVFNHEFAPEFDAAIPAGKPVDVLVVGGGINGVGIARDLAGRGHSVRLVERDDLAAHTSSASTKLIHGGLRYLEHGAFGLVRKSLREREVLLRAAPHIMRPLRFVMPCGPRAEGGRPAWLIGLGLFFYDHLARRKILPASSRVDLRRHVAGEALRPGLARGFLYSDGWVDDARLVVLTAVDARERGAVVSTRTECLRARRGARGWRLLLRGADGAAEVVSARLLVNAAGPWAAAFLDRIETPSAQTPRAAAARRGLRLVKGSHIVVPRLFAHDHAYIFQGGDKRIVFAIPYEHDFTLIGTTDVEVRGDPGAARIDAAEIDYLCECVNRHFSRSISPTDVVWSFSGVRPLLEDDAADPSAASRDYRLEADLDGAPLISVWGGKITTFRQLAEEAANQVGRLLAEPRPPWTAEACLPGGDLSPWTNIPTRSLNPAAEFDAFRLALARRHSWLPIPLRERWARAYGSRIDQVLGSATSLAALGPQIATGLHESELRYLRDHEWARTAEDVLWRRSKLGLHLEEREQASVEAWMARRR